MTAWPQKLLLIYVKCKLPGFLLCSSADLTCLLQSIRVEQTVPFIKPETKVHSSSLRPWGGSYNILILIYSTNSWYPI